VYETTTRRRAKKDAWEDLGEVKRNLQAAGTTGFLRFRKGKREANRGDSLLRAAAAGGGEKTLDGAGTWVGAGGEAPGEALSQEGRPQVKAKEGCKRFGW